MDTSQATLASQNYELVPIDQISPHPRNVNQGDVDAVVESIRANQFFGACTVQRSTRWILVGKHRWLAARICGLTEIPVIWIDCDEAAAVRIMLADNRTTRLGHDDPAALAGLLQDILADAGDLVGTGYNREALDELLASISLEQEPEAGQTEEDAVPEPPEKPVSVAGDLWLLGPHRLFCGDSTTPGAVQTVLEGGQAAMAFTDPPYNVNYGATMKDKVRGTARPIANDNLGGEFEDFLGRACARLIEGTRGAIYICMSSSELATLQKVFKAAGGHWSTFVIWAKNTFTMGRADYQRQYEPLLYGWREGTERFWCGARDQGDVWFVKKPTVNDLHPTMKPVELVERAVRNSSKIGDAILDPFGGSGSTLIACEKWKRQARVIELEPAYCDVIVHRWQDFSGGQATLAGDGRTFAEMTREREQKAA